MTWTVINGNKRFDFANPDYSGITAETVAHALTFNCRYNGNSSHFYSVAMHSILVARMLPDELKYSGLMHDAAEILTGDVIRPLKDYLILEACDVSPVLKSVEQGLAEHLGAADCFHPLIKEYDCRILIDEKKRFFRDCEEPWAVEADFEPLYVSPEDNKYFDYLVGLHFGSIKSKFIALATEYKGLQ